MELNMIREAMERANKAPGYWRMTGNPFVIYYTTFIMAINREIVHRINYHGAISRVLRYIYKEAYKGFENHLFYKSHRSYRR